MTFGEDFFKTVQFIVAVLLVRQTTILDQRQITRCLYAPNHSEHTQRHGLSSWTGGKFRQPPRQPDKHDTGFS